MTGYPEVMPSDVFRRGRRDLGHPEFTRSGRKGATADLSTPCVRRGGLRSLKMTGRSSVVVSHPFAKKKAKGWGTGLLWIIRRLFISGRNSLSRVRLLKMTGAFYLLADYRGSGHSEFPCLKEETWGTRLIALRTDENGLVGRHGLGLRLAKFEDLSDQE
jgi:hypothetical protein